jgi:tetratricopeptide (TPR) repeat protein
MKLKKLAAGITLLGMIFVARTASAQESAPPCSSSDLVSCGEGLARQGHWQKASEVFQKAWQQDPENVLVLHDLAVSYAHTSKLPEAAACERKALALDEKYVPSHIELAYVLSRQEDKKGAVEHLSRALELDPENKVAITNLETIMNRARSHRQGSGLPAVAAAPRAVAERAKSLVTETPVSKALTARGAAMFRQGKYEVARRLYEQALENCPDSVVARSSLGVVRGSRGDIEGQISDERQALALNPKDAIALCNLGWGLAQNGDLQEALVSYQKALELSPSLVEAQTGQGILLFRAAKPEEALAVLKESVRLNPEQALLRLALAVVLSEVERKEEALAQFQESLRLAPNNQEVKIRMAAAALTYEKFDKARELYAQLVERNPADPEFRIGLGLALTKTGEIDGAYREFKKAAELNDDLAAVHACLSMIEEMRGSLLQAENEARLALEKDPASVFFKESADRLAKSRRESDM